MARKSRRIFMGREKMSTYRTGEKLPTTKGNGLVRVVPSAIAILLDAAFANDPRTCFLQKRVQSFADR